ncbi:hypothetical protein GEMRC1_012141 [Eukaryota sp. GEM-RC1]
MGKGQKAIKVRRRKPIQTKRETRLNQVVPAVIKRWGKSSRKVSCPDFECDCDCDCDCQSKSNQIFQIFQTQIFLLKIFKFQIFPIKFFRSKYSKIKFLPEPTFSPVTEGPLLSRDPTYTLDSQSNLSESLAESGVHGPDSVSVAKEHRGKRRYARYP